METSYQTYLREGKIYAATENDICLVCHELIGAEPSGWTGKHTWNGIGKFDLEKHGAGDLVGYKHQRCQK